jgi:predicted acylesterase/phospholipase RssA
MPGAFVTEPDHCIERASQPILVERLSGAIDLQPPRSNEEREDWMNGRKPKRAITLAGRGPAAGLHIGVLGYLKNAGIEFDVWSLSGIGAWVGIVYNQADEGKEVEQTYDFFCHSVFRDDVSYESFPTNSVSAPDWFGNADALTRFLLEAGNYRNLLLPKEIIKSFAHTMSLLSGKRGNWNEGDINRWTLNDVLAVNPFVRLWTAMMFKSPIDGLSRIYYPDSTFIKNIKFEKLYEEGKPYLFHNAWNLSKQELQFFSNKRDMYKPISPASMCACSSLPYIDQTVEIDGDIYCEGSLVDTGNFKALLRDHSDLDEIWILRIEDAHRYRKPKNLHDSFGNLSQLYEATLAESDVKLFKYHCKQDDKWHGRIIEIKINSDVTFDWSRANLARALRRGQRAAGEAHESYTESNLGSKRNLNAWIDDPRPTAGKLFHVLINIGVPKDAAKVSVPFAEPDWHGADFIDLVVALSSIDCDVEPSWHKLKLPRTGDSETIMFAVTPNIAGDHEFSIRIYLAKQMIQLQWLSFTVTVSPAQIQAVGARHERSGARHSP